MKNDVMSYLQSCVPCAMVNAKMRKEAPPLHPIPVPSKVWSLITIDLMGPYQETIAGNRYIVAMSDHFSKWSEAAAIPHKTAENVSDFVLQSICRLGCMDTLDSDQGREFVNKVLDNLTEGFQIKHNISSAYHPQTQGQRERDNRTLKEMLAKLVNDKHDNWDKYIPSVLFAYNTSQHASTKVTPFQVMYGRTAKLPIDYSNNTNEAECEVTTPLLQEFVEQHVKQKAQLAEKVSKNIQEAQQRQKRNYDKRFHATKEITVGTAVLVKNTKKINRHGCRLQPNWLGPYVVRKQLGKGRLLLKNLDTGNQLKKIYHATNVKLLPTKSCNSNKSPCKTTMDDNAIHVNSVVDDNFTKQTSVLSCPNDNNNAGANSTVDSSDFSLGESINSVSSASLLTPLTKADCLRICKALQLQHRRFVSIPSTPMCLINKLHQVRGDGNCFFRAVCYILTGDEMQHKEVRDAIVAHMQKPSTDTNLRNYINKEVKTYLATTGMERTGTWATDAEVISTANLFGHDIVIYCANGLDNNGITAMSWLRYPASFSLQFTTDRALYLDNSTRNHFDVVLSTKGTQ